MLLAEHDPASFRSFALRLALSDKQLSYQASGEPLSFSQLQARRKPINRPKLPCSSLELANLGVSVRLTLNWQGHDYWLLVRQVREADVVLKLISGYVPSAQLPQPWDCALQEISEECLIHSEEGWLNGRYQQHPLTPYPQALTHRAPLPYQINLQQSSAVRVFCQQQPLTPQPWAYLHLPTASLQLVYEARLQLPPYQQISLYHVDEQLESGKLLSRLKPEQADLYLLALEQGRPTNQLFSLQNGVLAPISTEGLWLSEFFAPHRADCVEQSRISWADWQSSLFKQNNRNCGLPD